MFPAFSSTSQLKHLVLRAFLAGNLPKQLSKVGVLREWSMKKSNQTMRQSELRATFAATTSVKRLKIVPSADPADPPDLVHRLQLGTSPTRAGGQDDVSLN